MKKTNEHEKDTRAAKKKRLTMIVGDLATNLGKAGPHERDQEEGGIHEHTSGGATCLA
jgi:hypothetical protein